MNEKLLKAIEDGQVKDETTLAVFEMVTELQDSIPKMEELLSNVRGKDGVDGKDGTRGPKGDKGDQGEQGIQGPAGKNGKDGRDGRDGRDGQDAEVDYTMIEDKIKRSIPQSTTRIGWGAHPLVIQDSGVIKTKVARNINFTGATVTQSNDGVTTVAVSGGATLNPQTPVGTIDSANATFTITLPLNALFLNGAFQTPGGVDYTLSGSTITYVSAPLTGSGHYAL